MALVDRGRLLSFVLLPLALLLDPSHADPRGPGVLLVVPAQSDALTFARQLYADPSPLVEQEARLVYDPTRRRHVLIVDDEHRRSGTACLCLTQEEYDALGDRLDRVGFPEEGTVLDEYNELAYDECKRLAALIDGAVDDECLDYYEQGTWLKDIYFARGDWANGAPPGFTCDEP